MTADDGIFAVPGRPWHRPVCPADIADGTVDNTGNQHEQLRTECAPIHTSKIDGNRAADSAEKTGSKVCSPQDLIVHRF